MCASETMLTQQETKWILERRVTRFSDNKEVQIYPMGAERYLLSSLIGHEKARYNIRADLEGKNVLVIPGHGNSSFLMAGAGTRSVTTYDKDPVTIAWMKAFKKYYHYYEHDDRGNRQASIGELFTSLTHWYPPLMNVPRRKVINSLFWVLQPNLLRRNYIHYMVSLVQKAIQTNTSDNFELNQEVHFHVGGIDQIIATHKKQAFDTIFVPYLLGVKNGIENEKEIVRFIKQLIQTVSKGRIIVSPSSSVKDFYFIGARYFITTNYFNIYDIPELKRYFLEHDKYWFRRQGLAIFGYSKK